MVQLQQRAEQWAEQRWDPMARKFHPGATQKCGLNLDSAHHVVVMQAVVDGDIVEATTTEATAPVTINTNSSSIRMRTINSSRHIQLMTSLRRQLRQVVQRTQINNIETTAPNGQLTMLLKLPLVAHKARIPVQQQREQQQQRKVPWTIPKNGKNTIVCRRLLLLRMGVPMRLVLRLEEIATSGCGLAI